MLHIEQIELLGELENKYEEFSRFLQKIQVGSTNPALVHLEQMRMLAAVNILDRPSPEERAEWKAASERAFGKRSS